jgi:hypothetical protein
MYFESYDSMTDSVMFSKEERRDETWHERDADNSSEYYYYDSTGYRIYKPETEDDESEDEQEEEEEE